MALVKVNKANTQIAVWTKYKTDAFPTTPNVSQRVLSIVYELDTGREYRWLGDSTGGDWYLYREKGRQTINDRLIDVIRGHVNNESIVNKFGAVTSSGTHTTWKPVCTSESWFTPTAAVALEAVSDDNTNDVASGSGARAIRVFGLKTPSSTVEESEDVNLNGTTAVALANNWWRIYRVKVIESGTYGAVGSWSHDSTINIREVATPANIWAQISPDSTFGFAQSEIGCYSIPDGRTGILLNYRFEISDTNGAVNAIIAVRENADTVAAPYEPIQTKAIHRNRSAGSVITNNPDAPINLITGPADIFGLVRNNSNQAFDANLRFQLLMCDS